MQMRLSAWMLTAIFFSMLSSTPLNAQQPAQQNVPSNEGQKWYFRDPRTGRLYQRELRTVQQTVQQIVQTEIPESAATRPIVPPQIVPPPAGYYYAAPNRQPLIRIPILAQQQMIPWPSSSRPAGQNSLFNSNLFNGALPHPSQAAYSAPLNMAAPPSRSAMRDSLQTGMATTVLR